jgi:O-antigen/teichoic acid export membrane protein
MGFFKVPISLSTCKTSIYYDLNIWHSYLIQQFQRIHLMLKSIIKNKHLQSGFTQVSASALGVLSFMILARTLSKIDFGQWALYLTILTFVDMVKSGIVQSALIKYSSGASASEKNELVGSSWLLNLFTVLGITLINLALYFFAGFDNQGVSYFLLFYPLYALLSMPFFYFIWNHQVMLDFKKITLLVIINAFNFLVVCGLSLFIDITLKTLVLFHRMASGLSGLIALSIGNTGIRQIFKATKKSFKKFIAFGKYHMLAYLGSNLLKSSDTFIIGVILGPIAIALYSVPLRLLMLIEMPLTSAIAVAFPVFSAQDNQKKYKELKVTLEKYIGVLTILYVPFMVALFLLSDVLILVIGGEKYMDATPIFQIFLIYGLFLPFDRLTGIALDAIGKPKLNFYKVLIMAIVNILGDFIALYFFKSLELVALVTVFNVLAGIVAGYMLIKRNINIEILPLLKNGFGVIVDYFKKKEFKSQFN